MRKTFRKRRKKIDDEMQEEKKVISNSIIDTLFLLFCASKAKSVSEQVCVRHITLPEGITPWIESDQRDRHMSTALEFNLAPCLLERHLRKKCVWRRRASGS